MTAVEHIAVVVIGRNEGDRLLACLASLPTQASPVVYVDSGSQDGSVAAARTAGISVVELDITQPFTAARARNAGYAKVQELAPDGAFVQFVDGDCTLDSGWFAAGVSALKADPDLAVVCGRRREKFPEASLWNNLIDAEWNSPIGDAKYCGGDALMRRAAVDVVAGYREDLIAGEEPEICFRMRAAGWRIHRIDAAMTLHDAAMTRVSQWWQRSRRAGHTYAEGVALHGASAERYRVPELRRTVIWGLVLPLLICLGVLFVSPWLLLLSLIYPAQVLRLSLKGMPITRAFFLVVGKFPETQGVLGYWFSRVFRRRRVLIEYK